MMLDYSDGDFLALTIPQKHMHYQTARGCNHYQKMTYNPINNPTTIKDKKLKINRVENVMSPRLLLSADNLRENIKDTP